jgi:hypothetical protein
LETRRKEVTMILTVAEAGPLKTAIQSVLTTTGDEMRTARADDPDLFTHALGCHAIIYVPEANVLEAQNNPRPNPERMRAIVRAANAPGVKLVVVIEPLSDAYAAEEHVLRKDGVPYVILRTAPLIEELSEAANFHTVGSLWVSRGEPIVLGSAGVVRAALADALTRGDWQGATIDVPSERLQAGEAARRAAAVAGAGVQVHVVPPRVSTVLRRVSAWLGFDQPDVSALCRGTASAA